MQKQIEETKKSRYDVSEVFSPPRICAAAKERGFIGGWLLDIIVRDPGTGRRYDLRNTKDKQQTK